LRALLIETLNWPDTAGDWEELERREVWTRHDIVLMRRILQLLIGGTLDPHLSAEDQLSSPD
jgi:hypothetical protein